jgi:ketosteroid isomerase-like protein
MFAKVHFESLPAYREQTRRQLVPKDCGRFRWWHTRRLCKKKIASPGIPHLMAQESDMSEQEIRAALDQHWAASDANDFETEHQIYREDAVLEYPQSGERIRGRRNIQITRANQPSNKRFAVRRVSGSGDLWVTEYILTYDGKPSYTVSIMEFSGGKVARETQYFSDPFEPSAWRAQWVERMDR